MVIIVFGLWFNPLDSKGNYSATSINMKLVHWPMMGGLLHLVQRVGAWTPASVALSVASRYALSGYGDWRVRVRGPG